ncbi:hypothetical protein PRZ48_010326 [Zasmidium cellare]|uniref:Uncharacterized protein n=1 Tax=Zasmidium cellare TaxID=395010 RepID=A0ABR0E8B8_ZASCE|nr:hypothetical protein PRZ48_010326 [Zasmidium cellare]
MYHPPDSTYNRPRLKHSPRRSLDAQIGFLKKSTVFDHEEPYAFRYQADGLEKLTNMEMESIGVTLWDLRGQEEMARLDTCGFEVRTLRSKMTYEQFESKECITKIYVEDIKMQLCEDLGALHVTIERVRVRRRHPDFPKSIGEGFNHHQPSTAAHIGNLSDQKLGLVIAEKAKT